MSSLIYHTEETQVLVATDTLATSPKGNPLMFTTTAFVIPHLRMIVAGMGVAGFLGRWFVQINDRMVVRGIDHVDYHTPRTLAAVWREHRQEFSIPAGAPITVYHFGFSEETGLIHSFVYKSSNNFRSDQLRQHGLGAQPECTVPKEYELPTDIKTMMLEQRTIQAARPKGERICIGGEIQIHHLTERGFRIFTIDKFEDYDADELAIYENFRANRK